MLWVSLKELTRLIDGGQELTLDTIESTFNNNPFLEHVRDKDVDSKRDPLIKCNDSFTKLWDSDISSKQSDKLVSDWVYRLIGNDEAVRRVIEISIEEIQKIVSHTGSDANSSLEKTFLDVGVLRFPDIANPYIRVYHIQLTAWAECRKVYIYARRNSNGVDGEYHMREYKPREKVIEGLAKDLQMIAISEGEKLIQELVRISDTASPVN
ncbi:hypothetical protein EST38_g11586 [Candolleomyces aberdarensis]|uniref:Uncharacterized protein n=1 Tax=Candolleomyces aberdarensis TaxID=2316362 RepID=A0A4Q2D4J2_9AGAR|nr:hypothetical protein EST38_g11586 [Candolleomyces aberdarensis]